MNLSGEDVDTVKTTWPTNGGAQLALVNLTPYQLPPVMPGQPYSVQLEASGGKGPLEWRIVDGSLPSGFKLNGNRISCEKVQERMHAVLTVRVKDSEGMTSDTQTLLSCDDPDDIIAKVRHRGAFLFSAVMLAIAGGGVLLAGRILISLEEWFFTEAMRLRTVAGMAAPVAGPDWYAIAALCMVPLLAVVVVAAALQWHRRALLREANDMWGGSSRERQKLSRIDSVRQPCSDPAACRHCDRKQQYITRLLGSRRWEGSPLAANADDRYIPLANAVFAELRTEIAERALTCGLLVGVGQNRWLDALTIAVSSFEMQMFVLSSLGKRPALKTWWRLLRSSVASLFVNAYLNRQDVFLLNLLIRQSAWGLHTAAGASDYAAMQMRESVQHHVDHANALRDHGAHFDASDLDVDELHHGMNGVLKLSAEVAAFSFSTGAVALNQIAAFVEHHSADMVQGALAGGILYWHGCDLAADILAIDKKHRQSAELRVTVFSCAQESAKRAGLILQTATRGVRSVYRQRRMRIVKSIFGRKTWGQLFRSKA